MLLGGRVALVTGGSRGLGKVDAFALAEAGVDVVIADIVMEGAEKTSREIRARGRSHGLRLAGMSPHLGIGGVSRLRAETHFGVQARALPVGLRR